MGNENTEKKKRARRVVRAREIQKTRVYRHSLFSELTSYSIEETLLALKLPKRKHWRIRKDCYTWMNSPGKYSERCAGCKRTWEELKKQGHERIEY